MAIIPGKVWHKENKKEMYFIFIDLDKRIAIEEFCTINTKNITLQLMAQITLVEQHKDSPDKAHIYFYSPIPFPKKGVDSPIGLEVKGLGEHGIAYCSPSIHQNGQPYEIIGTTNPVILTKDQASELIQHIDNVCRKYGIEYLDKHYESLLDSESKIYQGIRHTSLIRIANSILFRYGGNGSKPERELKTIFVRINSKRCEPPLQTEEIDSIWNDAFTYYTRKKEQEKKAPKNEDDQQQQQQQSNADILVQLATDNAELFFNDQYGTAFALVTINTDRHREVIRLESDKFRRYLSKIFL